MTQEKELELCKRWFGVGKLPRYVHSVTISIKHDIPQVEVEQKDSSNGKWEFMGIVLSHYEELISLTIKESSLTTLYKIPPQYHPEWEQYVKDNEE